MRKQKFYVVWKGRKPGIYTVWADCEAQVKGFEGAQFKAFESREAAKIAFKGKYEDFKGKAQAVRQWLFTPNPPMLPSISVDAACSGSPGPLEYRGVNTETGEQVFRAGPFPGGTNNVGEFLAIVRGMEWLARNKHDWVIYSDSETAVSWVRARKCNTKLPRIPSNAMLFQLIARAEESLKDFRSFRIMKWDTESWGENPADFGRK
ncbi:MAG: ribonuclease H [Anaerolineae bacterium CG1_02_58_13]|nr:MAG: ribonuclease H [Anaerolineae bacterium CG1_02_58_13]